MAKQKFQEGALVVVKESCAIDVRGRQGVIKKINWDNFSDRLKYRVEFKDGKSPAQCTFISSQLDPYNPFSRESKAASFIDSAQSPGCEGPNISASIGSTSWISEASAQAMKSLI